MGRSQKPIDPSFQAMAEVLSLGMSYQLAASPDGLGRRFLYVSESCLALNGVTPSAVMADPAVFYDLVIPEHSAIIKDASRQAILDRRPLMVEYAIRRPDGGMGWRRATSAPRPELTRDGWSIWDGLQVDITEQKLAEQELLAQRQRLDLAVEASGLGLWEYHIRDDRAVWSPRTKALYGLLPDADIQFSAWFEGLIHPEDRAGMEAAYQAALETADGAFSIEHRAVAPDGAVRWLLAQGQVMRDAGGPFKVLGSVLDITERQLAEERRRLVANELAHRSKNGLAMIMAIIQQTGRNAATVKDYEALLVSRIGAMARSQDLVTGSVGPLGLGELFASALDPFDRSRFEIDPTLTGHDVNADVALMLALLIHELGTNATKYGALSAAGGRVELSAVQAADGMAAVMWREVDGPAVTPPAQTGFGTRLIEAALRTYGGSARAQFLAPGLEARLEFPVQGG